jgi:predicted alternative tryptophan synthase beta-subunit
MRAVADPAEEQTVDVGSKTVLSEKVRTTGTIGVAIVVAVEDALKGLWPTIS